MERMHKERMMRAPSSGCETAERERCQRDRYEESFDLHRLFCQENIYY